MNAEQRVLNGEGIILQMTIVIISTFAPWFATENHTIRIDLPITYSMHPVLLPDHVRNTILLQERIVWVILMWTVVYIKWEC